MDDTTIKWIDQNHASSKWLVFILTEHKAKTTVWEARNKSNYKLGRIQWYSPWRQYIYEPFNHAIYDDGCLGALSNFLVELNIKQRNR